jgi:transmembrane sensor
LNLTAAQIVQQLLAKPLWTEEDRNWFLLYLQQNDTPELCKIMLEKFSGHLPTSNELPAAVSQQLLQQIHQQIQPAELTTTTTRFINWKKWVAAAAVITGIATGTYFLLHITTPAPRPIVKKELPKTDVAAPNTSNAVITLGNGQQIILDSAGNGTLAIQGNVSVIKTADGQIVYNGTAHELLLNTLTNPRGSKPVTITLSDGSKVWLNSESSLRYPAAFTNTKRKVTITGEAYFEVAKNAKLPFVVNIADKGAVEVLGTHFNINSYYDEAATKVTLVEGSVKVTVPQLLQQPLSSAAVIKPGQQALYASNGAASKDIKVKNNVDVAAVVAWKEGFFNFDNTDLQTVLRQLERWYNVKVVFKGAVPKRFFGGEMQRDLNLSEVVKILEKNKVHFKIEGNKLMVLP